MAKIILSWLIWLPIISGGILLVIGNKRRTFAKIFALFSSLGIFILSLQLWANFDTTTHLMQFVQRVDWIKNLHIEYYLGIDGISLPLIVLMTFSTVIVVIAAWSVEDKTADYLAAFLIMEGLIIGVFSALDAILFYVFWEASLIPMLLIIGIWGGKRRIYASIKFFLYTFLGSVFMLLSFLYLFYEGHSFDILYLQDLVLTRREQSIIFWAFLLAFAVKVPMFPVHTWLPDAHVEAPTAGSVILAAIMLKMGGYGFFRLSLPILPDAANLFAEAVIILSLIAIVYIGFVALVQKDMKKLIAYSSISHMGFVTLGVFVIFLITKVQNTGALLGLEGAMVQMISHGFISAAMFLVVGVLYDRMHSRLIADYGGVASRMPIFVGFVVLFAVANAGLPGTSGFVGEFMVILASMQASFWYALLAALTLIIGAAYTLWMIKRVFFGKINNDKVAILGDISTREFVMLLALAVVIIGLGVYPQILIEVMHTSLEHLLQQAYSSKL